MRDRFDAQLVHTCSILSNDLPEDAYGQASADRSTWPIVATNVPCWIDTNAIGRPHENKTEPKLALDYRIIYMRQPTLSNGQNLNAHHTILAFSTYYDVFEVKAQYDSAGLHHLEVICEELVMLQIGESGS